MKIKLVAIAKDEGAYLPEWIFHHLHFGFDAIDIYINNITDNSREILDIISMQYPVKRIEADYIFELDMDMSFQRKCYTLAYEKAGEEGFSHILFLDLDEYWTPLNFTSTIHDCLVCLNKAEVISFEWANKINDRVLFAPLFSPVILVQPNVFVKSLLKTSMEYKAIRVHNSRLYDAQYILADGLVNKAQFNGKIDHVTHVLKDYYILHRLWRSSVEYVSLLGKGSRDQSQGTAVEEERVELKLNRKGYIKPDARSIEVEINTVYLTQYNEAYEIFLKKTDLSKALGKARKHVMSRAKSVMDLVNKVKEKDIEKVEKILRHVDLGLVKKEISLFGSLKNLKPIKYVLK